MAENPAPTTPDGVFLSPRVVDRHAFDDFAGRLRELVEQAGGAAARLEPMVQAAARAAAAAQAASNELAGRLVVAERLAHTLADRVATLEAILARVAPCEDLVARAERAAALAGPGEQELDRLCARAEKLREQIGESVVASAVWIDRLDERQESLRGAVEAAASRCEDAQHQAERRAAELDALVGSQTARIDERAHRVADLLERVAASRMEAETAIARFEHLSGLARDQLERPDGGATEVRPREVLDRVRGELGRELARLAGVIDDLAARTSGEGPPPLAINLAAPKLKARAGRSTARPA